MTRALALLAVCALLALAVLRVRHAMQERRSRAQAAWQVALRCAAPAPCAGSTLAALEAAQELPEHAARELELAAALREFGATANGADATARTKAMQRVERAGVALGWRTP